MPPVKSDKKRRARPSRTTARRAGAAKRRRPASAQTPAAATNLDQLERRLRPMVRRMVDDAIEERIDVLVSREALKDPEWISHEEAGRRLRL